MTRVPQFLPPRQCVVYAYTRRMLDETATNANTFAMSVAELYLQRTAPDVRTVPFRLGEGDELIKAMKANGQTLRRYMDGTVKVLPADLEDAWVLALPDPYRSDCERDLASRRDRYSMPHFQSPEGDQVVGLGELLNEFGRLCEALAPALADGRICEKDLPHAQAILRKSDGVIAAVLGIRGPVTNLLASEGSRHAR